jgi:plastocyanin domain-containing protein
MKGSTIIVLLAGLVIAGAIVFSGTNTRTSSSEQTNPATAQKNNVTITDGKQIIEISARGGYQPEKSIAQAGIPTIIRFKTNGTFDCSSSVRIPSLDISKALPQTGTTDIDIGTHDIGTLQGTCGMGMYPFEVAFAK